MQSEIVIKRVKALRLQDGDVLVVEVRGSPRSANLVELRERIEQEVIAPLGKNVVVIITDEDVRVRLVDGAQAEQIREVLLDDDLDDEHEIERLLDEHCQQYGHEWRTVSDGDRRSTFCVRCSTRKREPRRDALDRDTR
jgi:NAD(P)H-nitrite reductase large subunit